MPLTEFPDAIASFETKLFYQSRQIRTLQAAVIQADAEIDEAIAFDATLKNDAQRKSVRLKLQANSDYQKLANQLQEALDDRTLIEIELTKIQNLFAISKLEARFDAAIIEARFDAALIEARLKCV